MPFGHERLPRDGDIGVREEQPAHAASPHGAADLGRIAETEADDGVAVAVVREVGTARRRNEFWVEAEAELTELRRAGCGLQERLQRVVVRLGMGANDLAAGELEPYAGHARGSEA